MINRFCPRDVGTAAHAKPPSLCSVPTHSVKTLIHGHEPSGYAMPQPLPATLVGCRSVRSEQSGLVESSCLLRVLFYL